MPPKVKLGATSSLSQITPQDYTIASTFIMDALPFTEIQEELSISFPLNKNIIVEKYVGEKYNRIVYI